MAAEQFHLKFTKQQKQNKYLFNEFTWTFVNWYSKAIMKLKDLMDNYGCINCPASQNVVDKYNKIDKCFEIAVNKALKDLETEKIRKQHLENDKIGKIKK